MTSWQSPAWLLLQEDTLRRTHLSGHSGWDVSAVCCQGEGAKLGRGLLPGLEGHLDIAHRQSFWRMSPGAVKGEAWRGLHVAGLGQAGLTFRKVVDAECHLLSHRSCQHPGFAAGHSGWGCCFQCPLCLGPSVSPTGQGGSPKAAEPHWVHLRDEQGAALKGTARDLVSALSQMLFPMEQRCSGRRWAGGTLVEANTSGWASAVFLLALKAFGTAWAQRAPSTDGVAANIFPLLSLSVSVALQPHWRGRFSLPFCLSSPRLSTRKCPRDKDCGCLLLWSSASSGYLQPWGHKASLARMS